MDYHQGLQIAGGLLALLLFIPLILSIVKEGAEGQSCATWLLWGALDTILTFSLLQTGGNYFLPLGFAIGDFAVVILLVVKGKVNWGMFETIILLLVMACLAVWKWAGPMMAAISSTLAVVIAGLPGLRAMLKNPQRRVGNIWMGYVLANVLSFFGGTAMTVKERFTPGVFAFFALLMFVASRRKKPVEEVPGAAPSPWILPH